MNVGIIGHQQPRRAGPKAEVAGTVVLSVFLGCHVFSAMRYMLGDVLGGVANTVGTVSLTLCGLAGIIAPFVFVERSGSNPLTRFWFLAMAILVCALAVFGFLAHRPFVDQIVKDTLSFLLVPSFVLLGGRNGFIRSCAKPLFWFFLLALVVNMVALRDYGDLIAASHGGERVARETDAYRVQNLLDLWPLLLLLAPGYKRWQQALIAFGVVFIFGEQVLFQKRLETVFVAGMFGLWWLSTRRHPDPGALRAVGARMLRIVVSVGLLATLASLLFFPKVAAGQFNALLERFEGRSGQASRYSRGVLSVLTLENERVEIALACFEGFEALEWLTGRGMGGAFEVVLFDPQLLNTSRAAEILQSHFLPDYGYFGRRGFETGALMPLLKGGWPLMALVYLPSFVALFSRRKLRESGFGQTCLAMHFAWLGYTLMGGSFTLVTSLQMLASYVPLGWALAIADKGRASGVGTARSLDAVASGRGASRVPGRRALFGRRGPRIPDSGRVG